MRNLNQIKLISFCLATAFCACKANKSAVAKAEPPVTPVIPPVAEVKPKSACDTVVYTFTKDIKPLIQAHCMPCHGNFSSYEQLKMASKSPSFLGSIMHEQPYHPMPKKAAKLSDSTIQVFQCWIENGQNP